MKSKIIKKNSLENNISQNCSQLEGEKNQSDIENSGFMCNICFALDSDCIFMPCGHGGVCLGCSKDVVRVQGECYLCRAPVELSLIHI